MGDETARKAAERERERGQLELILARIANDSLLFSMLLSPTASGQKERERERERERIYKICML